MSRSKQLGGFATSGVFGFRQTRTHAPEPPTSSRQAARLASASASAALAAMSISFPTRKSRVVIRSHRPQSFNLISRERSGSVDLREELFFISALSSSHLTILAIRDAGVVRTICRVTHIRLLSEFAKPSPLSARARDVVSRAFVKQVRNRFREWHADC